MSYDFHETAFRAVKLPKVSFHSLWHTNASIRIEPGRNIKFIQIQLGHASIKMALDVYRHLLSDGNFSKEQVGLLEERLNAYFSPKDKMQLFHQSKPVFQCEL
jgi:integrase